MSPRRPGMLAMALVASLSVVAPSMVSRAQPAPANPDAPAREAEPPAPDAKSPDAKAPDAKSPDAKAPDAQSPDGQPPNAKSPAPSDDGKPDEAPPTEPAPPPIDPQQACMDAFGRSQRLRRQSRLLEARDELLRCGQAACLSVVRNKCLEWLEQVEGDLPTVVIAVVDRDGQPPKDVRILVDGNETPDATGGRAFSMDPGEHIVRVELPGGGRQKRVVTVLQGQKNQSIIFDFQPPKPPPSSLAPVTIVQGSRTNIPAAIAFSVGGVSLLAGIITGAIAMNEGDDLEEQCDDTGCTQDEIDRGLAVAHASTATLAIAGVAGALGVTFLFVFDDEEDTTAAWQLTPGGGRLTLRF